MVSTGAGIVLGIITSVQDGFFGALGFATLLHALTEPKGRRKTPAVKTFHIAPGAIRSRHRKRAANLPSSTESAH